MQVIHDSANLTVAQDYCGAPITVVTFTGIGRCLAGVPTHEFYRGLSQPTAPGRTLNIVSVIDKNRYWYNNGLTSEIAGVVNELLDAHGSSRTVTLGTSMGGYGAVIFAKRLRRCDKAIGFGAHYSIHPILAPFDVRSADLRAQIETWDVRSIESELASHIEYELYYGADDTIDLQHSALYAKSRRSNVVIRDIAGAGHNVAGHLKDLGLLYPLLDRSIWRSRPRRRRWRDTFGGFMREAVSRTASF